MSSGVMLVVPMLGNLENKDFISVASLFSLTGRFTFIVGTGYASSSVSFVTRMESGFWVISDFWATAIQAASSSCVTTLDNASIKS